MNRIINSTCDHVRLSAVHVRLHVNWEDVFWSVLMIVACPLLGFMQSLMWLFPIAIVGMPILGILIVCGAETVAMILVIIVTTPIILWHIISWYVDIFSDR